MTGPLLWLIYLFIRIPHARLIAAWSCMQQTIIDEAVDQLREHLYCCVKANSRHSKHLL